MLDYQPRIKSTFVLSVAVLLYELLTVHVTFASINNAVPSSEFCMAHDPSRSFLSGIELIFYMKAFTEKTF